MKNPKLLGLFFTGFLATIPQVAVAQSLDQLSQQGNAVQQAGKYSQTESIWRRLIQLNPKSAKAYYNLGIALYDQKKLVQDGGNKATIQNQLKAYAVSFFNF